jgi:hypothetical protein
MENKLTVQHGTRFVPAKMHILDPAMADKSIPKEGGQLGVMN